MQRVTAGAQEVADLLHDKTGLFFDTIVATEYAGVIEALSADPPKAHMASMATFAYILAADRNVARAALVSVRFGSPSYNGQFIVRTGSGITSISDLKGKTFARPDPLSTSGWIIPMLTMRAEGLNPESDLKQIVDVGSHESVVAAVYNGEADAGSTYVDARARQEADLPDVMTKVGVIKVSVDIPNDGVQFSPTLSQEMQDLIAEALLEIAGTDEGKAALEKAYQWNALEKHDDSFYDPFRQVLQASGLGVDALQE
jgi:phosphonate transport system substrate-binding protein